MHVVIVNYQYFYRQSWSDCCSVFTSMIWRRLQCKALPWMTLSRVNQVTDCWYFICYADSLCWVLPSERQNKKCGIPSHISRLEVQKRVRSNRDFSCFGVSGLSCLQCFCIYCWLDYWYFICYADSLCWVLPSECQNKKCGIPSHISRLVVQKRVRSNRDFSCFGVSALSCLQCFCIYCWLDEIFSLY